jgi:predicted transposase YdaD
MEESVTYQEIVEKGLARGRVEGRAEGSLEEARQFLLRLGRKRFGPPDAAMLDALGAIAEVARLEELGERLLDTGSWQELVGLSSGPSRGLKRRR